LIIVNGVIAAIPEIFGMLYADFKRKRESVSYG
jgi:hypothetical protein